MNDLYSKFKDGLNKGVKIVSSKSKEMLDIAKVNTQILGLQQQRKTHIDELGKIVYEMYCSDNFEAEAVNAKCKLIEELDLQIKEKQEEIKQLQQEAEKNNPCAAKRCECGAEIKKDDRFCGVCGKAVEEPAVQAEPTMPEEDKNVKLCECGAELEEGTRFCGNCGKRQE